jgi:predicted transcriptional regulator
MNTKSDRETAIVPELDSPQAGRNRLEELEISRGLAEIKAGQCIDDDQLEAWLDQLETNPDAPMPTTRPSGN